MGGTPRIWMVATEINDSALPDIDKAARLIEEARQGVEDEALRESPLGLVTSTSQGDLTKDIATALEKKGWIVSHTIDVVAEADVVVSIEDAISYYSDTMQFNKRISHNNRLDRAKWEQVMPRLIYAGSGKYENREIEELGLIRDSCAGSEWVLRPAEELMRLLPSKWYRADDLVAAFPGEPLVRVRAQRSPFERIADNMEEAGVLLQSKTDIHNPRQGNCYHASTASGSQVETTVFACS